MRLFIALPLPSAVEHHLGRIIDNLKKSHANVKWVKSSNIHLTLRFLGETDQRLVPELTKMLDTVSSDTKPFTISSDKIGAFPNTRKPRVVWAGMSGSDVELMYDLANKIEKGVRQLGFEPEERSFKPHLTLGRLRDPRQPSDLPQFLESYRVELIEFVLDKLVLFQSTLTPKGPIYDRLHEITLAERFGD